MSARPILLLIVLLAAGPTAAQTLDKEKLRAAAYLPKISVGVKFSSGDIWDRAPDGRKTDLAAKADGLRKQLTGTVKDAELYLELADCYDPCTGKEKQLEAARKAEELL